MQIQRKRTYVDMLSADRRRGIIRMLDICLCPRRLAGSRKKKTRLCHSLLHSDLLGERLTELPFPLWFTECRAKAGEGKIETDKIGR